MDFRRDVLTGASEGPSSADWETYRGMITDLYYRMPLRQVNEIMKQYGFSASKRMYDRRFRKWSISKHSRRAAIKKPRKDPLLDDALRQQGGLGHADLQRLIALVESMKQDTDEAPLFCADSQIFPHTSCVSSPDGVTGKSRPRTPARRIQSPTLSETELSCRAEYISSPGEVPPSDNHSEPCSMSGRASIETYMDVLQFSPAQTLTGIEKITRSLRDFYALQRETFVSGLVMSGEAAFLADSSTSPEASRFWTSMKNGIYMLKVSPIDHELQGRAFATLAQAGELARIAMSYRPFDFMRNLFTLMSPHSKQKSFSSPRTATPAITSDSMSAPGAACARATPTLYHNTAPNIFRKILLCYLARAAADEPCLGPRHPFATICTELQQDLAYGDELCGNVGVGSRSNTGNAEAASMSCVVALQCMIDVIVASPSLSNPHLASATPKLQDSSSGTGMMFRLVDSLATVLRREGDTASACRLMNGLLKKGRQCYGPASPQTRSIESKLAKIYLASLSSANSSRSALLNSSTSLPVRPSLAPSSSGGSTSTGKHQGQQSKSAGSVDIVELALLHCMAVVSQRSFSVGTMADVQTGSPGPKPKAERSSGLSFTLRELDATDANPDFFCDGLSAHAMEDIAEIYSILGDVASAIVWLERAVSIAVDVWGKEDLATQHIDDKLAKLQRESGKVLLMQAGR